MRSMTELYICNCIAKNNDGKGCKDNIGCIHAVPHERTKMSLMRYCDREKGACDICVPIRGDWDK